MYETFCKNCSHFILEWFQFNSFGELCFLEESYGNMQKIQILKFWKRPLFDISEYAFKYLNTQLPRIIAEPTIHPSSSNGWAEFWPEQIKFLVDMLKHAHWLRTWIDMFVAERIAHAVGAVQVISIARVPASACTHWVELHLRMDEEKPHDYCLLSMYIHHMEQWINHTLKHFDLF